MAIALDIYQLKITLKAEHQPTIKPPIWRRIQMSKNSTFEELHYAVINSMGWEDIHLHNFRAPPSEPRSEMDRREFHISTIYHDSPPGDKTLSYEVGNVVLHLGKVKLDESETKLCDYFKAPKDLIEHEYDMNHTWIHTIVLEEILPSVEGKLYPVCIAGERACPPPGCKGVGHYYGFVEVVSNPGEEYEEDSFLQECREWLADDGMENWDPEAFDPNSVKFFIPPEKEKLYSCFKG